MKDVVEQLEARIKHSLYCIERDKRLLQRFKDLHVKIGDVIYHKEYGKGMINKFKTIDIFDHSMAMTTEDKTITDHIIVAACGFISEGRGLDHMEVNSDDLILYSKITETLYD